MTPLRWTGIDHVRVWSHDVEATTRAYARLFDAEPDALGVLRSGGAGVAIGPAEADRSPDHRGGLVEVALSVVADEDVARLLIRRGLPVEERGDGECVVDLAGLRIVVASGGDDAPPVVAGSGVTGAEITGLDHLVVHTRRPDRALALWGARLGLDLRLDRSNSTLGVRFLFFRCGRDVVEVAAPLPAHGASAGDHTDAEHGGPDRTGGLAWRTADLDATRLRLVDAGVEVSEVRAGRKPGTRVATVREPALALPTLLLEQSAPKS
ncbi:VOC family protein [Kribbia dieselivorans]|uniref:VOC family protein n=1 Tax=Kribbia dieselivorans TaxID=331526 RepID=UPI000838C685|nr:VOC family protein [Kribbia dieselivorans]